MRNIGFTLIELVMIIVILGILFTISVPFFVKIQAEAKEADCKGALGSLRSGIGIWYTKTVAAGVPSWPTIEQLTATTNGVMVGGVIPENPYTRSNAVKAGAVAEIDTEYGWIYDANTGRIWGASKESLGF